MINKYNISNIPLTLIRSELESADKSISVGEFIEALIIKNEQLQEHARQYPGHTIVMEGPNQFKSIDYKPTCKCDCTDCIYDPAYIYNTYPEWYKKLYGELTPEEAAVDPDSSCSSCNDGDRYDDEDK